MALQTIWSFFDDLVICLLLQCARLCIIRINHENYLIVYIYSVFQQIIELIIIKSNY